MPVMPGDAAEPYHLSDDLIVTIANQVIERLRGDHGTWEDVPPIYTIALCDSSQIIVGIDGDTLSQIANDWQDERAIGVYPVTYVRAFSHLPSPAPRTLMLRFTDVRAIAPGAGEVWKQTR